MIKSLFGAAALGFLTAGTALAGGFVAPVSEVPVAVESPRWQGAYVGAFVAAAQGDYLGGAWGTTDGFGPNVAVSGTNPGIALGYNIQRGGFVYGVEFDYRKGPEGRTPQGTLPSAGGTYFCGTGDCTTDITSLATLRARIGYSFGKVLVFASAGLAQANVTGGIESSSFVGSSSNSGIAYGIGGEYALNDRFSVRLDALQVDLGDIDFGVTGAALPYRGRGDFAEVRLGVNLRF